MNRADDIFVFFPLHRQSHVLFNAQVDLDAVTISFFRRQYGSTVALMIMHAIMGSACVTMAGKTDGIKAQFNGMAHHFIHGVLAVAEGRMGVVIGQQFEISFSPIE